MDPNCRSIRLIFLSGPLELTRRIKVLVWDEEVEVAELDNAANEVPASPTMSISSVPIPKRSRSQSYGEFPPPMRRTSTDASGAPRPVPFAAKFQRIHPGTTGVTVLEHLERLDAVEASLQRLGVDEEEVDMGVASAPLPSRPSHQRSLSGLGPSPFSPPGSPLATVPEGSGSTSRRSSTSSIDEEDLVAMSKSTSHVEGGYPFSRNIGTISTAGLEWISPEDEPAKRTMIAERLETVKKTPLCSCW
ncbi:phosphatidyl inositol kinase [Coprinopsis cinerea AmutBmut pab1-1]|nr:phosphatidyl inositol kinase [Coprinopsis cinerea AmutBmut pab1-1]